MSVCSEEVPAAWPSTEFAGLFDAETFSSDCGLMKPEPEIYLHTARALEADPADCLFVGDGANDELAGAERVGMTPGALPSRRCHLAVVERTRVGRTPRHLVRAGARALLIARRRRCRGFNDGVVALRIALVVVLAAALVAGGASGAAAPATGPTAGAKALAVRIVFPNGRVVGSPAAGAAGALSAASASYSYPGRRLRRRHRPDQCGDRDEGGEDRQRQRLERGGEHLALQRRDHRRLREGARERGDERRERGRGVRRHRRRPPAGARPRARVRQRDARRLGLPDDREPQRDEVGSGRHEELRRRLDRARRQAHGRSRRAAGRNRDPGRIRRGLGRDGAPGRRPTRSPGPRRATGRSSCRRRPAGSSACRRSSSRR